MPSRAKLPTSYMWGDEGVGTQLTFFEHNSANTVPSPIMVGPESGLIAPKPSQSSHTNIYLRSLCLFIRKRNRVRHFWVIQICAFLTPSDALKPSTNPYILLLFLGEKVPILYTICLSWNMRLKFYSKPYFFPEIK